MQRGAVVPLRGGGEGNAVMRSFIICTVHQMLFGGQYQDGLVIIVAEMEIRNIEKISVKTSYEVNWKSNKQVEKHF
jgi:hypothetical protein